MARIIRKRRDEDTRRADRMTEILQTIANLDSDIASKQAQRLMLASEAKGIFDDLGKEPFIAATEHGEYVAQETRSKGRASSSIDPAKFRKMVKDDKAFFGAIKVLKEPAEALLSGKELESITTTTPAVAGDPVFAITAVPTKKK
jgi:hypothetical protein